MLEYKGKKIVNRNSKEKEIDQDYFEYYKGPIAPSDITIPVYFDIEPIIKNPKDGSILLLVPGGKFLAGGEEPNEGGGEPFELEIPSFYLGMHAVTNAQYKLFVDETGHRPPDRTDFSDEKPIWKGKIFPKEKSNHSVVCISWDDAQAYCKWAGSRLPTELEWEKASRGTDGREYPWGNEWKGNYFEPCGNETVDMYAKGCSPYGHYNISGILWEWCEDWYDDDAYYRYRNGDLSKPRSSYIRVLRGGSWGNIHNRPIYRDGYRPVLRNCYIGFRLAQNLK